MLMTSVGKTGIVFYDSIGIWLENHHTSNIASRELGFKRREVGNTILLWNHLHLDAMLPGILPQHHVSICCYGLRYQYLVLFLTSSHSHHHSLGTSGRAIVHRGIRDVHTRQFGHHRLIFKDIVQCALRYLSLIGSVRGKEL